MTSQTGSVIRIVMTHLSFSSVIHLPLLGLDTKNGFQLNFVNFEIYTSSNFSLNQITSDVRWRRRALVCESVCVCVCLRERERERERELTNSSFFILL